MEWKSCTENKTHFRFFFFFFCACFASLARAEKMMWGEDTHTSRCCDRCERCDCCGGKLYRDDARGRGDAKDGWLCDTMQYNGMDGAMAARWSWALRLTHARCEWQMQWQSDCGVVRMLLAGMPASGEKWFWINYCCCWCVMRIKEVKFQFY